MSPEAASERANVTGASDIYAFGAILFTMVSGTPPFSNDEPVAVLNMHLSTPAPRLQDACPNIEVPPALEGLVARCLAKTPFERPTAAQLVDALTVLRDTLSWGSVAEPRGRLEELPTAELAIHSKHGSLADVDEAETVALKPSQDPEPAPSKDMAPRNYEPTKRYRTASRKRPWTASPAFTAVVLALVFIFAVIVGVIFGRLGVNDRANAPPPAGSAQPPTTASAE